MLISEIKENWIEKGLLVRQTDDHGMTFTTWSDYGKRLSAASRNLLYALMDVSREQFEDECDNAGYDPKWLLRQCSLSTNDATYGFVLEDEVDNSYVMEQDDPTVQGGPPDSMMETDV